MDADKKIEVSIVVPFYNPGVSILNLLDSIFKLDYPIDKFELILLVDDGSTDDSIGLVKEYLKSLKNKYQLQLIRLENNLGPAAARNRGIWAARGNIIAFTDADCIVDREWLKYITVSFMKPNIAGVFGKIITDKRNLIFPLEVAPIGHKYITANCAYRREILLEIGGFDERFKQPFRENTDLALEIIKKGYSIIFEEKAIVYHPSRKNNLKRIVKEAFLHQYDVLLYKKHSKLAIKAMETSWISKPVLGPFSILFLGLIVMFVISFFISFKKFIILSVFFFLFLFLFFVFYGYRFVILGNFYLPFGVKLKVFIASMVYLFSLLVGRIYGSLKFKAILI